MRADIMMQDAKVTMEILIVEDDSTTQQTTKNLLNQLGCHFDFASTGKEAISADFQKYHMIFLDIFLPDINGFEIAHKIKRLVALKKDSAKIPIIAYTSFGEEIREACLIAGFDDFLFKPAEVNDFRRLIQRLPLKNNNKDEE